MRGVPWPGAFALLHPALPRVRLEGRGVELVEEPAVEQASLSRRDRLLLVVQLLAAVDALGALGAWPGLAAVRQARVVDSDDGRAVRLPRHVRSLSCVERRHGAGPRYEIHRWRRVGAVVDEVFGPIGHVSEQRPADGDEPGREVARLLADLRRPLPPTLLRSLVGVRLPDVPVPVSGALTTWQVPDDDAAVVLAAQLWARLVRRGRGVWVTSAGLDDSATAPMPPVGFEGTLIVAGAVTASDLAALERWAGRPGCSSVVLGSSLDDDRWPRLTGPAGECLALTGLDPADAAAIKRSSASWFEPTDRADRRGVVDAVAHRLGISVTPRQETAGGAERVIGLLTEGVPQGFVELHAPSCRAEVERLVRTGRVVLRDGRWRLVRPVELAPDPLHAEVAGVLEPSDPRRAVHLVLAGGDPGPLASALCDRLDRLEAFEVRALLDPVRAGTLGTETLRCHVEACLLELDVAAARTLASVESAQTDADASEMAAWQSAVQWARGPQGTADLSAARAAPRAWLGAALTVLSVDGASDDAATVLSTIRDCLNGACRRLADRVCGGEPTAQRRATPERLIAAVDRCEDLGAETGRTRRQVAVRLCRLASRCRSLAPGPAAVIALRAAREWCAAGEPDAAERAFARARSLFDMVGAVRGIVAAEEGRVELELERLELARARRRLERISSRWAPGWAPSAHLRWRIAFLADGRVAPPDAAADPLAGAVQVLLDGHLDAARKRLEDDVPGASAWRSLTDAVAGLHPGEATDGAGGWGVELAAELAWRARREPVAQVRGRLAASGVETVRTAFAVALLERLAGAQAWLAPQIRARMVRRLEVAGLHAWARVLGGAETREHEALQGVCDAIDRGGVDRLGAEQLAPLLAALGIDGVEVVRRHASEPLWRVGSGVAAEGSEIGELEVRPLGAKAPGGPLWRLLVRVCWMLTPAQTIPPETGRTGFAGVSAAAEEVRQQIARLAPLGLTVLITGESGTGKEVVARALCELSAKSGQFHAVNMAAVPGSLFEAEVFGTVRGAYTGADRRDGLAVTAGGGTLFLDEIGELGAASQAALLRFLDSGEVRAVGSDRSRRVDVRLIAATNRDLKAEVAAGSFREDLLYRLQAASIHIPPLRERPEDILVLRDLFQSEAVDTLQLRPARWSAQAEAALRRAAWPGNARELRTAVQRALVAADGSTVRPEHFGGDDAGGTTRAVSLEEAVAATRRRVIAAALTRHGGNRSAAARELGLSRQTLLYHINKLGIG